MAVYALNDVDIFVGGASLECIANQAQVMADADELDATTFCAAGWTVPIAGKRRTELTVSGPQDFAAAVDNAAVMLVDEHIGTAGLGQPYVWSAAPQGASPGAVTYFSEGPMLEYAPLEGAAGELGVWSGRWAGRLPLLRGTLGDAATIGASSVGNGFQLGVLGSGQRLWAAVHVLAASGTTPSITFRIESDDGAGFPTPTTRLTLNAMTGRGGQIASLVGPVATDSWWRFAWTISGTSPSIQFRTVFAIA